MSLQAYQKTQRSTENTKQTEYRLFAQVTQAMIEADRKGRADLVGLIDALDWNRRLWSTLAADCSSDGNQLPPPVRAQIISISLRDGYRNVCANSENGGNPKKKARDIRGP